MNNMKYSELWSFIGEYLPNYYSRNDVLRSGVLFRFLEGDEIAESDRKWIDEEFGGDLMRVKQECLRLDKQFFVESLQAFYDQMPSRRA
ncbi:MAG: hypothetical protein IKM74_10150 [Bacteroidales bacterium]|nr:hypothetical protein [Bacteroidales bacterium]